MKIYKIKVNGKVYEVEVEVSEKEGSITTENKARESAPIDGTNNNENGERVNAPMEGTILSIKVSKGSKVSKGDVLLVLEAMKMENEILAPVSGVVTDIFVSEGKSVNNKDTLVIIS